MTGPPSSALSRRALRAAVEVADAAGLRCERPVVLRDHTNLLAHLSPAAVVARVATATAEMRRGDAWLAREVAVASYLADAGAPVVAPSRDLPPGPHHHDGLVLTFWELAEAVDAPLDARRAGRALRTCHEALAGFPGELPPLAVLDEAEDVVVRLAAEGVLDAGDAALLEGVGREVRARVAALALPWQAVHGDAHLRNVITTSRGPLWNDWEDTFLGPVAWDLGCLHASARAFGHDPAAVAAAQEGYGPGVDDATLDACVEARRFQGTVWSLLIARRREAARERAAGFLAWYRR